MTTEKKPHCCVIDCAHDAEFRIYGRDTSSYEDFTDACREHVGELLGTPDWAAPQENRNWHVEALAA